MVIAGFSCPDCSGLVEKQIFSKKSWKNLVYKINCFIFASCLERHRAGPLFSFQFMVYFINRFTNY